MKAEHLINTMNRSEIRRGEQGFRMSNRLDSEAPKTTGGKGYQGVRARYSKRRSYEKI